MSVSVVQCRATSRTGKQCKNKAIPGGAVCRFHGGASPHVVSKAAVRAEVWSWGLGDTTVDPGEVLFRFVTQSAARAQRYAMLLEEAYEAAERLKQAHDAGAEIQPPGDELADTAETARRDLDRIFNTGGVAALVGNTPADYDPAALQGIHARYVLVINDEADVSRSRSSMRSTPWQRTSTLVWSQSGTPMIPPPTSPRSANQAPVGMWRRSARSTRPHTPGERVPDDLLPWLVSPEWVE